MDVQKIAPIVASPLDACRGRGKRCPTRSPRVKAPDQKKKTLPDFPNMIIIVSLEPPSSVGKSQYAK